MTTAAFTLRDRRSRHDADRRLSIALGISLVAHALTIAALRGSVPRFDAYPQAGAGSFPGLQAVLAGPLNEPPEPPVEPVTPPSVLSPPADHPVELPASQPPKTGLPGGGDTTRTGPNPPEVSVAIGVIADPAKLGPDFVARVAQRFPNPVQKPPMLLSSPAVIYPSEALESGMERRVAVLLTVLADGSIADLQLVREDPVFGPVVLDALTKTRFAPAEIDGQPVPYWTIVEFVFSLGGVRAPPVAGGGHGRRGAAYPRYPSVGR